VSAPGAGLRDVVITADASAVVVRAGGAPLRVVSTAVVGGGFAEARTLVNLQVGNDDDCADPEGMLAAFAARRGLPGPLVGLLTAAWTERAVIAEAHEGAVTARVVSTVGLSHPIAAGHTGALAWHASTINVIAVVTGDPEPAALVNAVATIAEVKVDCLRAAGLADPAGRPATGTATDAVAVAATGVGPRARFGGPASELGAAIAKAARASLEQGVREWLRRAAGGRANL
jgi:iron complex transport system ATP-binding protein